MIVNNTQRYEGVDYILTVRNKVNNQGIDRSTATLYNVCGEVVLEFNKRYRLWRSTEGDFKGVKSILNWLESVAVSEMEVID